MIAEGVEVVRSLLRSRFCVRSILVTPDRFEQLRSDLSDVDAPVYLAHRDLLRAVVGFDLHRGAVAAADRPDEAPADELVEGASLVLVAEGLNDHENLGALFRNAAAFGCDAVLLDPTTADPLYRRCVRVSMGHVLHVRFGRVRDWPDRLSTLGGRFEVLALTPAADAEVFDDVVAALPRDHAVALVVGSEGFGLTSGAMARARRVRIPMAPGVDSLNVATAAAIGLSVLARYFAR